MISLVAPSPFVVKFVNVVLRHRGQMRQGTERVARNAVYICLSGYGCCQFVINFEKSRSYAKFQALYKKRLMYFLPLQANACDERESCGRCGRCG